MSSSPPVVARPRPPWFLLAAMVMTWFIGMYGVTAGFDTAAYLRQGTMPEYVPLTGQTDDAHQFVHVARQRAIAEERQRTLPLAIAKLLLSLLLVAASVMAIAGRKGGASLVTQALLANMALAVVDYALTKNVRAQYIEAVVRAGPQLFANRPQHDVPFSSVLWWTERIKLVVFDLGTAWLALAAVHAKRSKSYFEASSRIEEEKSEPDDDDL